MVDAPFPLAFLAAVSILTVTPGVDTAIVLRAAAAEPRAAVLASVGIALGCLGWGAGASLGLGALLQASAAAYAALKWVGAGYLVWMGARLILRPRTTFAGADGGSPATGMAALRRGLLTNALNPKVGVFYVTFLPQFVPPGASVPGTSFLLTCIHVGLTLAWFAILIAASIPLGRALRRPSVVGVLDRLTGAVFVGFGIKLAASRA